MDNIFCRARGRASLLKQAAAVLSALALFPAAASAQYEADTDTGAQRLDFIENLRRIQRENTLTDEQKRLVEDTERMKESLRYPIDPTKASPMAFEGDELTYDETTGEFTAVGKVHIVQLDRHQFDTPGGVVHGNLKDEFIEIPGESHVLQLTEGQSRVTLDGVNTFYNYGQKTGSMGEASGKVDHQYVTGRRFEFYPDRIVIFDGTATRCGAKKPDYHQKADKITIYPNDKMVMDHVSIWLKGACLYTRDRYVVDLRPDQDNSIELPRVGYDKDDGVWISHDFSLPIRDRVNGYFHLYANTKDGLKSRGGVNWGVGHSSYSLNYGHYEDGDNNWIKKEPTFIYKYSRRLGTTHLHYSLNWELGRWHKDKNDITSTHRYYGVSLWRDPISLGGSWYIHPYLNYGITQETYDDSEVKGFSYSLATTKVFDDRWAMYATYAYSKSNSENSLFDYDLDSFSRKLMAGFSYRFSPVDRLVVGMAYNLDDGWKYDATDYYWFHDLHCAQLITHYKSRKSEDDDIKFTLEFTPW